MPRHGLRLRPLTAYLPEPLAVGVEEYAARYCTSVAAAIRRLVQIGLAVERKRDTILRQLATTPAHWREPGAEG